MIVLFFIALGQVVYSVLSAPLSLAPLLFPWNVETDETAAADGYELS